MGKRKKPALAETGQPTIKLKDIARALQLHSDDLRARFVIDSGGITLEITTLEAEVLTKTYGQMPNISGIQLLLSAEEPRKTVQQIKNPEQTDQSGPEQTDQSGQRDSTASSMVSSPEVVNDQWHILPAKAAQAQKPAIGEEWDPKLLIRQLDDPERSKEAEKRLVSLGKRAVALLIEELPNPARVEKIKVILAEIGINGAKRAPLTKKPR